MHPCPTVPWEQDRGTTQTMSWGSCWQSWEYPPLLSPPCQLGYVCSTESQQGLKIIKSLSPLLCCSLGLPDFLPVTEEQVVPVRAKLNIFPFSQGLFGADFHRQLLSLYKQQMFCIYALVSKHTGMEAFTGFSLTSAITVKRKQILRICSD